MNISRLRALALGLCLLALSSCSAPLRSKVLHVNSLRGQIWPSKSGDTLLGGFSLLSSAIKDEKNNDPGARHYVIAVYNALHGTAEAHFTEGRAIVDLMNATGFDALILGPRDFYFGMEALERLAAAASFPFVAANIGYDSGSRPGFIKPFLYDPKTKLGLIGLAPRQVLSQNLAQNVRGLAMKDEVVVVREALRELKALGAKTVGLFAGGIVWGGPEGSEDGALAAALLELDGIDQYWFGSPSPGTPDGLSILESPKGPRIASVQSGARFTNGHMIAQTAFAPSPEGAEFRSIPVSAERYQPDADLSSLLYTIEQTIAGAMNSPVAASLMDFVLDFEQECSMGNLVCDIFRDYTGSDVFFLNSGKIRSALSQGSISRKDVYDILPFGGNLVSATMSGDQILALLNKSVSYVGNPKAGRGFLQVSGISFAWDSGLEAGSQVLKASVRIGDEALDPARKYRVATEAYIFGGGDGYGLFAEQGIPMERFYESSILTILEDALRSAQELKAPGLGRISRR
jgi:5'-nucleotidase / UDP-sugar diphosphatase